MQVADTSDAPSGPGTSSGGLDFAGEAASGVPLGEESGADARDEKDEGNTDLGTGEHGEEDTGETRKAAEAMTSSRTVAAKEGGDDEGNVEDTVESPDKNGGGGRSNILDGDKGREPTLGDEDGNEDVEASDEEDDDEENLGAALFADKLIEELKRENPPLVPRAPNLRAVLGLADDVLLVRTADLVRKAMDELALALHWHLLYTLVHSAWHAHRHSNLHLGVIRFRGKSLVQPVRGRQPRGKRPPPPEVELRVQEDANGNVYIEGLEEFQQIQSLDLRVLLSHVVRVNTTSRGMWTFKHRHTTETYYPQNIVRLAQLLGTCANFFSHRNAVVPRTVSDNPTDQAHDFEDIRSREVKVSTTFFAALDDLVVAMHETTRQLQFYHEPRIPLDDLYLDGQKWVHGFCRSLLDACSSHLRSVTSIRSLFGKICDSGEIRDTPLSADKLQILLSSLEQIQEQVADSESEELSSMRERAGSRNSMSSVQTFSPPSSPRKQGKGKKFSASQGQPAPPPLPISVMVAPDEVIRPDPREVRFALYTLWTRFGAPEGPGDGIMSETSGTSTRTRPRVSSIDSAGAGSSWQQLSTPPEPNESLEFGTIRVTRLHIEQSARPRLGVQTSFTVDPLGVTHVDLIHRMLDVTLLALRQILIHASTLYMQARAKGERQDPLLSHVIESALLLKSNGKTLRVDWPTLKLAQLEDSQVAIFEEASHDPVFGRLELFSTFSRRKDVGSAVQKKHWSPIDVVRHFFRYEPRFADPRFVAEFLRRLLHPRTGAYLFPEANAVVDIRDRAMHHFHLIHSDHYSISELYHDLSMMRNLVVSVSNMLHVDPLQGRMKTLWVAMEELEDLIGHYKRWRSRQHVAFHYIAQSERLDVAVSTVRSLLDSYDESSGAIERKLRSDLEFEDGSSEALAYLLELFGSVVDEDGEKEENPYDALVADYDGDDEDNSANEDMGSSSDEEEEENEENEEEANSAASE